MTDPISSDFGEDDAPVRSGWRRALLAFAGLGLAAHAFGRIAFRLNDVEIPMGVVMMTMFIPLLATLGFGLWWLVFGDFSRLTRVLTVLAGAAAAVGLVVAAEGSFGSPPQGMKMFALVWGVPLTVALTGLVLTVAPALRGWPLVPVALVAASPWLLLRNEGVTGSFDMDVSFRWGNSRAGAAEQQLADRATVAPASTAGEVVAGEGDWPGFRGADRSGVVPTAAYRGWDGTAPKERWRKASPANPVGPAWSSVCVAGNALFTQEQRGEAESVVCYRADDGQELWSRGDPGKHTDWASGSGPRATPTLAGGRLLAATASGAILALKPETGDVLWRVDLKERFGATKPQFGWSASPLVVGELVIVHPASPAAPRLVALSAATGETKWQTEAKGTDGYSSPQLATLAGAPQVLQFNGDGLAGHDPATGAQLWQYAWKVDMNQPTTVQPLVLPGDVVVIGGGNKGLGTRGVKVKRDGAWTATEEWATTKFTPVFNDVVRSGDALFGLDTGRLVCLDLKSRAVKWREGSYGSGQVLLVGDKLLVVTENGRLACVPAAADEYEQLWELPAVPGKTWNHPAVAGGRLYVRNATEMAAFDLPGYTGTK